tara:strand:- start:9222 stop:12227 length:3006 start_codon:yes stop_codon:yes gene_type:complete
MVGAQSDNDVSCEVLVDWDYESQFSEDSSQYLDFVHRYRVIFDPPFESGEAPSALTVDAIHRGINGDDFQINFDFISAGGEVDITLDSSPNLGETISISLESTQASCSRGITVTNWNQPVEDHEITRETTWSMEGVEDEAQGIEFEGRGWQKRSGDTLESNELGNGSMQINTMDEESNGLMLNLNLDRVWLNETYEGQQLLIQEFEMEGNGTMVLRDGFSSEQGPSEGLDISVSISHASILRSWSDGHLAERIVIEGNGWLSANGGDNESSEGFFGSIEVFYFETWDVDGSRRLDNFQLEANASIRLMGAAEYFTFELDELKIREKWEDHTRVEQFFKAAGSGEFAFEIDDDGFQVDVNGTVPIVHLESSGGEVTQESIIVDGTYDGDAEGSFGYVRQIVDSGPQENFNGTLFEVNKIQDEFWFNVSATPFGPIDQEFGAEHNLTYEFTVPQEDWYNRTLRYQYVEDNGSVTNEYPQDSPIISEPERPQANPMSSLQISRETGFAPENVVVGDVFVLSGNPEAILEVEVIGFTQRSVDGHDVEVAQWVGEYGEDSYASGFVINEGPLSGLLSEVFRWIEVDFSENETGSGTISLVENQVVDRILYPSVITEDENTLPTVESVSFREGILLTEGGNAHLEVTVVDVDTDVISVSVDLSFIEMGVVALSDSGLDGDITIHDDIWTAEIVHPGLQYGEFNVTITINDYWAQVTEYRNITITNSPPRVDSVTFAPTTAKRGDVVSVSVVASDGHGVSEVSVDLLSAGGVLTNLTPQTSQPETPWEGHFIVPTSLSPGARVIPLRLTDGEGETILVSNPAFLPLLEVENEDPSVDSIEVLSSGKSHTTISDDGIVQHFVHSPTNDVSIPHTLEVVVNDPDGVSSVQAKIGRLAEIGKSDEWLLLVDDGSSGDRVPGDGVYTLEFNVRPSVPEGEIVVLIRASDIFFATTDLEDQAHTFSIIKSDCCSDNRGWFSKNAEAIAVVSISALFVCGLAAILLSIRKSDFD